MVLPISGFLPVPLPMMIPFMGAQSLVIGKMFGEGFQYGKRKISAMPNDEFNALTFQKMMSNARDEMKASIPTMQEAMRDMQPMVETVVHEFVDYLGLVLKQAPTQAAGLAKDVFGNIPAELVEFQKRLEDLYKSFGLPLPAIRAYADIGTSIPLTSVEDTHEKRVALQKIEDARVSRQQQLLFAKTQAAVRLQGRQGIATAPVRFQQAAGQSQRLEKAKLIRDIVRWKADNARLKGSGSYGRKLPGMIRQAEQALVNLLDRYRF